MFRIATLKRGPVIIKGWSFVKSWFEISGAKLAANFRAVQAVAGEGVEVLAVIKANAYGHGATLCAPLLVQAGARWLGVTDVEEGIAVRNALGESDTRMIVMCGMVPTDATSIVLHDLTPVVWTETNLLALEEAARRMETQCSVHIEIDTGMARQGVAAGDSLTTLLLRLKESRFLRCEGVMTHFCCSEVAASNLTMQQCQSFDIALEQLRTAGISPNLIHLSNTSAVDEASTARSIRNTARAYDARVMVRTGFALYGHCLPIEGEAAFPPALLPRLQPVAEWKTRVIGLRDLQPGDSVGYGATFTAGRPMRLALLPVGYADGFRRAASSGIGDGWVIVAGQRAPVVGRVSMNLTTIDVTALEGVAEGDEVVLLGDGVSAEDHARWANTIPYDILCGIRARFVQT